MPVCTQHRLSAKNILHGIANGRLQTKIWPGILLKKFGGVKKERLDVKSDEWDSRKIKFQPLIMASCVQN
jgi:hypothetical protein